METVYIIGIITVAVVILGVAWLLRDRITSGRFGASAAEKKIEAGFEAAPPSSESRPAVSPPTSPSKPPAVDISDNWMIGANVVRILRDSVRVARNKLLGKQRLEVKATPPPEASPRRKNKKSKKANK